MCQGSSLWPVVGWVRWVCSLGGVMCWNWYHNITPEGMKGVHKSSILLALDISWSNMIWVRSQRCSCLVTWLCYQMIAKPGNKTAAPLWPDPYVIEHNLVFRKLFKRWTHKRHPYLALTGKLWGVFCDFFVEKWPWDIMSTLDCLQLEITKQYSSEQWQLLSPITDKKSGQFALWASIIFPP